MTLSFISFSTFAFDNVYVSSSLDRNVDKFISVEIAISLKESVDLYNINRNNKEYFLKNASGEIDKKFINENFGNGLPEITSNDDYYVLKDKENTIQFNAKTMIAKAFYLNGQLIRYKNYSELIGMLPKKVSWLNIFMDEAHAGFIEDSKSTKLLLAGIMSMSNTFEDTGITCIGQCDTVKLNFKKLQSKVDQYLSKCDSATQDFEEGAKKADQGFFDTARVLGSPFFNEGEEIDKLFKKMNDLADKKKDKDLSKILDNKLKSEMNEASCNEQVKQFMPKVNNITGYMAGDRGQIDTVGIPSFCAKVETLKTCMSTLYSKSKSISQTMQKKGYSPGDSTYQNIESRYSLEK